MAKLNNRYNKSLFLQPKYRNMFKQILSKYDFAKCVTFQRVQKVAISFTS